MIIFFALVFLFGLLLIILDLAVWANHPAPSTYRNPIMQWGVIIAVVGVTGALCVLPTLF